MPLVLHFAGCLLEFCTWKQIEKFLPESIFLSKQVSIILLLCHLGCLGYFFCIQWPAAICSKKTKEVVITDQEKKTVNQNQFLFLNKPLSPIYITTTLFVSNYIGICFARSIHYQFYCWYFHSIPYLLWYSDISSTASGIGGYPILFRLIIVVVIELAYLTFPATPISSLALQMAHFAVLLQIQPATHFLLDDNDDDDLHKNNASSETTTVSTRNHTVVEQNVRKKVNWCSN